MNSPEELQQAFDQFFVHQAIDGTADLHFLKMRKLADLGGSDAGKHS